MPHTHMHDNITLKHTLPFVDLKIKHYPTSMYVFTQIFDKRHLLRTTPNQLQIGTSMSQKGHEGSKMLDFLISQQKATVANITQFKQYSG